MRKGAKHSEETIKKMRETRKGEKNAMFGRHHSKESIRKNRESNLGHKAWNKGLTKETDERVKKNSEALKGPKSQEHIKKLKELCKGKPSPMQNKHHSEIAKKRQRLAAIKRMQKSGMKFPSCNLKACEFFKSFDEEHNTKGKYAMYGGGEFLIKELGYFPDYFNPNTKLIMEYDEIHHYDENGYLLETDAKRQKEIMELYPDFEFRRIKDASV